LPNRDHALRCPQFLNRRRLREQVGALRPRPEAALELPDEAFELADPLADPRRYATESEGHRSVEPTGSSSRRLAPGAGSR
jgi:hypothetical protein